MTARGGAIAAEQPDDADALPSDVAEKKSLLAKGSDYEAKGTYKLEFQDNVQGAVLFACMKTIAAMRDTKSTAELWKLRFSLLFIVTPALLCYAMQAGFIYALYKVDDDAVQNACSVGAWLKLCSIALFFICVYSVTLSALAHTKIIALCLNSACRVDEKGKKKKAAKQEEAASLILRSTVSKIALFLLCVLPEVLITVFMIPVGVIYIFIQQTMETTIIAAVAMLFVIEIDECIYLFFPEELREQIEEAGFKVNAILAGHHESNSSNLGELHHHHHHHQHEHHATHEHGAEDINLFLKLGVEPIIKLYVVILITLAAVYGLRDAWLNCECFVPSPRPDLM
jgi:hypothetical protein